MLTHGPASIAILAVLGASCLPAMALGWLLQTRETPEPILAGAPGEVPSGRPSLGLLGGLGTCLRALALGLLILLAPWASVLLAMPPASLLDDLVGSLELAFALAYGLEIALVLLVVAFLYRRRRQRRGA